MSLWERENKRNTDNEGLFRDMLQLAYPDTNLVVSGHHIFHRRDASAQHEEIPSADALIFDHTIAKAIWGEAAYMGALTLLAVTPAEDRDALLQHLFITRTQ